MFDVAELIADCIAASAETNAALAIRDVLDRAVRSADQLAEALPANMAELDVLYSSPELSVIKFVWGPGMSIPPHDHLMWAVNGVYTGAEDNVFYRRHPALGLEAVGGNRVDSATTAMLGSEVIHAVTNPSRRSCTGSIHVYGGDYVRKQRSIWDAETFEERPADGETARKIFEDARAAAEAAGS